MGKSSLIIVFGFSVIIAFFMLRLNSTTTENVSTTMNMFQQTQSRLIANSGVEIYLEKLKHDRTMLGKTFNDKLFGGTYTINISGPESLVVVTSTADFMKVGHKTVVEAAADKIPFHPSPGALYLNGSNIASFKKNSTAVTGSIEINGYDHKMDGSLSGSGNNVPGISVDGEPQRLQMIDLIHKNAYTQVQGLGGFTPNVHVISNTVNWSEYAQLLADNPDIKIPNDSTKKWNDWGTISNPKVTFINGDVEINDADLKNGGCGILVVNGNLKINGGFKYIGLIVAFKNANIELKLNGNGTIIGGMVAAGQTITVEVANGDFNILYSAEALAHIQSLIKTKRFTILSWWE